MATLHVDDAGFVRAPAWLVYRRLTDVGGWPTWWPGARVRSLPARAGDEAWLVELRGAPLRRLRVAARPHGWRHEQGFSLALTGDLAGGAEFWLEPGYGGTVVHHLLVAESPRRDERALLRDHRVALRRGLWGLKDLLQLEARTSGSLTP